MYVQKEILLVEDNNDDVELTQQAMSQSHIQCDLVVKQNGVAALQYLHQKINNNTRLPDLILLDINMPKMGGIEMLHLLKKEESLCFIPVIILTSSTEERDLRAGYQAGANSYIRKPVHFEAFMGIMQQLVSYWLELNEVPQTNKE